MQKTNKTEADVEVGTTIATLIVGRKAWEAGTYAASNAELYALLGQSIDLLYKVKHSTELARGLNHLLKQLGYKFNAGTSTEVKLLRAVFGDPANPSQYQARIYSYARVLMIALEAKVTGKDLPNYIMEHGGIDEIRRCDPKAASKPELERLRRSQAERTMTAVNFAPLVKGIRLTEALQPAPDQHFSVALVRKEGDGSGTIVFGTSNPALVSAALGVAGRKFDSDEEEARNRRRQQEIQLATDTSISEVTSELSALSVGCIPSNTTGIHDGVLA